MPSYVVEYPDLAVPGAPAQHGLLMQALRPLILREVLARQEPWTIRNLADALGIGYGPMVRHVGHLQDLGWVEPQLNREALPRYFVANRDLIAAELRAFVDSVLVAR